MQIRNHGASFYVEQTQGLFPMLKRGFDHGEQGVLSCPAGKELTDRDGSWPLLGPLFPLSEPPESEKSYARPISPKLREDAGARMQS